MNLVKSRTPIGSGAKRILVASLTGVLLLAPSLIQGVARAENGPRIAPAARLEVSPAAVRGPAEWDRDANLQPSPAVRIVPINRPTLDEASYRAAKAAADTAGASATGKGDSPAPLGPPLNNGNYTGVNESTAGFFFPPDTEGVVGTSHLVEVTNSHIDIYTKAIPGVLLKSVSLATFFGTTETLFDPRAIFDPIWKRYIITADAFPISATVQHFWWAISLTSNANGSYFVYAPNVDFGGTSSFFFDFPMVGNDQDGVIFTANIFNPGFVGADEFSVAKAALYNGLGFGVPVFTGLCGTLATPNVLDNNGNAFLVCAPGGTGITTVSKYTLTNSSRPNLTALAGPASITVPAYSIPPSVTQPGLSSTADHLDSSDARFSNVSSQIGTSLFQTHTILDITATPKFYEFNTSTNAVVQSGIFFEGGASEDFNASIAANSSKNVFVTWDSVLPSGTGSHNVRVRFSGRLSTDALGIISKGSAVVTSSVGLTGNFDSNFGLQRWGDYSATSIDPANNNKAWSVNEWIQDASDWTTRILKFGY